LLYVGPLRCGFNVAIMGLMMMNMKMIKDLNNQLETGMHTFLIVARIPGSHFGALVQML